MVGLQVAGVKNVVNFEPRRQLQLVRNIAYSADNWEGPFILTHQSFVNYIPEELE
jgi:hypothetical protein